ncbi:MAG TPA: sensor domain-containing diguanylate cyclase [Longimicrobiales bacterium]
MASSLSFYSSPAERYTVLLELARTVASSFVPAELCRAIHIHVTRVLPASSFTVALAGVGGVLRPEYQAGPGPADFELSPGERAHLLAGDFVVRTVERQVQLLSGLVARERLVGALVAGRGAERPFDAADAHFLLAVGAVCGAALENAQLFQDASRGREEAELLETVARELGRSLELQDVAGRIVARASEVAQAPASLWLLRGDVARLVASSPASPIALADRRLTAPVADRLAACVGVGQGAALVPAPVEGVGDAGTLLVPMVAGGRLVAFLTIRRAELPPPAERDRLMVRLGLHALSALQNVLLHEEVRRLSLTDPLVDLPNRRQLDFFLEKEFAAAQRGRPLCFALFDLDHFKEFNDAYGHQAGDQALIRFAGVLRTETRAMNLAARYGGEEFAAVLSETSRAGAHAYAQRVRRRMGADPERPLTVSAGVAVYAESMTSAADLVAAADRALYRAKLEGRNKVCVAD